MRFMYPVHTGPDQVKHVITSFLSRLKRAEI